jgi:hypothetical protein
MRDVEVEIKPPGAPPSILQTGVAVAASQGDDGVGSPDHPEHAGLFESRADYGLAAERHDPSAIV